MESMDLRLLILVLVALAAAGFGAFYRHRRAQGLEDVTDEEFLNRFYTAFPHSISRYFILQGRNRVASILGIPAEKLAPEQHLSDLSKRFEYLGQFSVGWTDLDDEAEEMRQAAGLETREELPQTVGELVRDLAAGKQSIRSTSSPTVP